MISATDVDQAVAAPETSTFEVRAWLAPLARRFSTAAAFIPDIWQAWHDVN